MNFDDLMLDEPLLQALAAEGFITPTPVQQETIPPLLAGEDVLACAATGTGKTLAFVLPLLQKLLDDNAMGGVVRSLILAPTRELAFQTQHVIQRLASAISPRVAMVIGGQSPAAQVAYLQQGCDIIIATPGRMLQLLTQQQADLSAVEYVVIDEADRMLDMGQGPDVARILASIQTAFQTSLFSATLAGAGVELFAKSLLPQARRIEIDAANQYAEQVSQSVYLADNKEHKLALLKAALQWNECQSALVFCNKKERAIEIADYLQSQNISAQVLHGDYSQADRRERTRKFRQNRIKVLVATDVAARGLDLPQVSHVINYDVPFRGDIYIHRVGRTGRAGQPGNAINLVESHDQKNLQRIEHHIGKTLPQKKMKQLAPKARFNRKKNKNKPRYIAKTV